MTSVLRSLSLWMLLAFGLGCDHSGAPSTLASTKSAPPLERATGDFGSGVVRGLPLSLLVEGAPEDRISRAERIAHDARFAHEMRARDAHMSRSVWRGVLARALLNRLSEEARKEHPLTEDDLEKARQEHFLSFDRPRAVRTAQAFIPVALMAPEDEAYAAAERVLEKVKGSLHLQAFAEAARAAQSEVEVGLYRSPPVAADGRVIPLSPEDQDVTELPLAYAEAAAALTEPGQISGIVGSEQGFHILFATEIIPALRPTGPEANQKLEAFAVSARLDQKLADLKQGRKTPVSWVRKDFHTLFQTVMRVK